MAKVAKRKADTIWTDCKLNSPGARLRNVGTPKKSYSNQIKDSFGFVVRTAHCAENRRRRGKYLHTKSRWKYGGQGMTSASGRPAGIIHVFPLLPRHVRIYFFSPEDRVLSISTALSRHGAGDIMPHVPYHDSTISRLGLNFLNSGGQTAMASHDGVLVRRA